MERDEVSDAIQILLDELENVIESLDRSGSEAFHARKYEQAREIAALAQKTTEFRSKVTELKQEWKRLTDGAASVIAGEPPEKPQGKEVPKRFRIGPHMPQSAFVIPILEALVELGGSASAAEVLRRVYEKVKDNLSELDLKPLPSHPHEPTWHNSAQWCRFKMVKDGLLKSNSSFGVWEITEAGRAELARSRQPEAGRMQTQ